MTLNMSRWRRTFSHSASHGLLAAVLARMKVVSMRDQKRSGCLRAKTASGATTMPATTDMIANPSQKVAGGQVRTRSRPCTAQ